MATLPVSIPMENSSANVIRDMMVMSLAESILMNVVLEPTNVAKMELVSINLAHFHANVIMDSMVMVLTVLTLMNVLTSHVMIMPHVKTKLVLILVSAKMVSEVTVFHVVMSMNV